MTKSTGGLTRYGTLAVIAGPMFSGKTEELIRRVKKVSSRGRKVQVFNHSLDSNRYGEAKVVSHIGTSLPAISVKSAQEIVKKVRPQTHTIAIDEAQFFGRALVPQVRLLLKNGHHVILAGLCLTWDGKLFHPMPQLMAEAETTVKLAAKCGNCNRKASFHSRIKEEKSNRDTTATLASFIGGSESYVALCRTCR